MEPLNDSDFECLKEIRDVLKKHNKMKRLGVALLHTHFSLQPDEILLEKSYEEERKLVLKPVKQSEISKNSVGTIWALQDGEIKAGYWCKRVCNKLREFHNSQHHEVYESEN